MTQPLNAPDPDAFAANISQLAAGNAQLIKQPQIATALANINATPQQAGAINQFLAQQADQSAQSQISQAQGAGLTAQAAIDAVKAQEAQANKHSGLKGLLYHVVHNPVTDILGKGQNLVNSTFSDILSYTEGVGGSIGLGNSSVGSFEQSRDQQMLAAGYDPNNPFSIAAFMASGLARQDLTDLKTKTDPNLFSEAELYANDPQKYQDSIINDLNLTADEKVAKLDQLQNKDFQDLASQIAARSSTVGHYLFNSQSKTGQWLAAGTDLLVGFKFDPFVAATGAVKGVYLAPVTMEAADDTGTVYRVLAGGEDANGVVQPLSKSPGAIRTRQGFKFMIDKTAELKQAKLDNDLQKVASIDAQMRTVTPDLYKFAGDFAGETQVVGFNTGKQAVKDPLVFGPGKQITNLTEAANYFGDTLGLARLRLGMPVDTTSVMPGRLSNLGARQLRGALAGASAGRGVKRLTINLKKAGFAQSLLATPADNVDAIVAIATGNAAGTLVDANQAAANIASGAGATLPSQLRGVASAADIGDVVFAGRAGRKVSSVTAGKNVNRIEQGLRSLNPKAVGKRMQLLGQRWSSSLNRDERMSTQGNDMPGKILKYGQIYLPRSYAHVLSGLYSVGDEGARKAILHSLAISQMHAAGLGTTIAGREMIDNFGREFEDNVYGLTGSRWVDPVTQTPRDSAIWESQLNEHLTLPNMQKLMMIAPKVGLWENTIGAALNRPVVRLMTDLARIGWVFRSATALRAVQEDLASSLGRGRLRETWTAYMAGKEAGLTVPYSAASEKIIGSTAWQTIVTPLARFYHGVGIKAGDDAWGAKYTNTHDPDVMKQMISDYSSNHMKQMLNPDSDVSGHAAAGFNVKQVRVGFGKKSTQDVDDSMGGAQAYATHLRSAIEGNPDYARRVVTHIRLGPTASNDLVKALKETPGYGKYSRETVYHDDQTGMDIPVATDNERAISDRQHVDLQIKEMHNLLTSADGRFNDTLADYIMQTGQAPTAEWIADNIPNADRPSQVLGAIYQPVPKRPGVEGFLEGLLNGVSKGYSRLVEAPIARWSVQPQYLANYNRSMKEFEGYRALLKNSGMSDKAALDATRNISYQRAWHSTMRYVDDPTVRDQLDLVGKAFFGFSRATTAFIRRWSTQFVEDPARARRLMLTYEAANQSGFMFTDANGQKQFIYPGSGVALRALSDGLAHLGVGNYVPALLPNLTSRFAFLNPGLQNPFQYSLTPIGNIPLRGLEKALPGHRAMLDEIDQAINGQVAAGEGFGAQLVPTVARNFYQALNDDDKDSMVADATRSAILTLEASGQAPPPNADAATRQAFLTKVRAQVKNQLMLRAIFSFVAPASPSEPTEESSNGDSAADPSYQALGFRTLNDEYKELINQLGIEEAGTVWAGLHPDKLMYTVAESSATTKGGYVNATKASLQWMQQNASFMKGYSGIASYFIPQADQQGDFDLTAYNAEFELGLRQHKSTEDYYQDVTSANANNYYFQVLAARDKAIAQRPDLETQIRSGFSAWASDFAKQNPVWAQSQPDYGGETNTASDQLAQLQRLADSGDAPKDVPVDLIRQMIGVYNSYHEALLQFPRQTNADNAGRAALGSAYNQWWSQFMGQHPELGGVYTGVFRTLDNKTLDSLTPVGGQ